MTTRHRLAAAFALLAAFAVLAGCRTSTRSSGLPAHIKTVEVHIFGNKTMYKGIETTVTRQIIDRINHDPTIRVVSRNGDAVLSGEITEINRTTVRETTTNDPATVSLRIHAVYSFYDAVERTYLVRDRKINSSESSGTAGLYEASSGETTSMAEESATRALAGDIVRHTIGKW